MGTSISYRPDIDGLRAVAVISVVGYHYFPEIFRGGLVGVDVFFVISGFLISGIILKSLDDGKFSLLDFYRRRVRRIAPSLVVVLLAVLFLGWIGLFPSEYRVLGRHVTRASFFVLNFNLLDEVGYFDQAAAAKPLLHLWSLSIEEQFYLFWPLFLWAAWRFRSWAPLAGLIAILVVSFSINVYLVDHGNAAAAFYLPQARFWELAAGAIAAYLVSKQAVDRSTVTSGVLSTAGVVLVVATPFFDISDNFPGWKVAIPVAGAAMIVLFGGETAWPASKVLTNRVAITVGLISYPLYLWHWPLYSFGSIAGGGTPGLGFRVLGVTASAVLAGLTYRYIEKPIRFGQVRRWIAVPLVVSMLVMAAAGYGVWANDGVPQRLTARFAGSITRDELFSMMDAAYFPCEPRAIHNAALQFNSYRRCYQSKRTAPPTVAIVGDSHAEHLFPGLAEALPQENVVYYTKNGLLDGGADSPFSDVFDYITHSPTLKTVIISEYWRVRAFARGSELVPHVVDSLSAAVERLVEAGKRVFITNDVPNFPFVAGDCLYEGLFLRKPRDCSVKRTYFDGFLRETNAMIDAVRTRVPQASLVDTFDMMCTAEDCSMAEGGDILYIDSSHLNILGSRYLARKLIRDDGEFSIAATRVAPGAPRARAK